MPEFLLTGAHFKFVPDLNPWYTPRLYRLAGPILVEMVVSRSPAAERGIDLSSPSSYFSAYGGLWIDRNDWKRKLDERLTRGAVSPDEAGQIERFVAQGYLVIPGAVAPGVVDRFSSEITKAWLHGDERLMILMPGEGTGTPLTAGRERRQARVVDSYAFYQSALEILLSGRISRFLTLIFDDDPLLFQSLSFDCGSEQGMHQDTAYVVVGSPLEMAASWVALEDIEEGSGELMYIPGSHRIPEYHFSGGSKHFSSGRDTLEQHEEWSRLLLVNSEKMGLTPELFRPKKGDALIWAADLVHGGAPVKNPALSRRSLVGHYCPGHVDPYYFLFRPDRRTKIRQRNGLYSSMHYSVA
jgi:phytanoyl-CoA hydroxylase